MGKTAPAKRVTNMSPEDMRDEIAKLRNRGAAGRAELKRNRLYGHRLRTELTAMNIKVKELSALATNRTLKYIYYRNLYFGLRAKFVKLHRELYEHFDEKVADVYYDTTPSIAEALGDEYGGEKDWYTKRRYDE